jgi:septum formation protein
VRRTTLRATCVANARLKAEAVARRFPTEWVLAADTMIAFRGRIYGKPRDRKAAVRLLQALSGSTHTLGTAVVLQKGTFRIMKFVTSRVTLHEAPPIEQVVARTDPTKYAGGYAIRAKNDPLIKKIEGSSTNVIGLPMEILEPLLKKLQGNGRPGSSAAAPALPKRGAPLKNVLLV